MEIVTNPEKLTKAELVDKYKELAAEYQDLESQDESLDESYGELECSCGEAEEKVEQIKENRYEELLKDLRFNTELQNKLFSIYQKQFNTRLEELANFYCVDIPDKIYKELQEAPKGNDEEVYKAIENYIEDFTRFK